MTDDNIRIRWSEGERTFAPGTVLIGRDLSADVQPTNANVSRRHAELTHTTSGWVLRDLGSAQGTWRGAERVEHLTVAGRVSVTLGRVGVGEEFELEAAPEHPTATPAPTAATEVVNGVPDAAAASAGTVVVGAGGDRPGGRLREDAIAGATVVTGDTVNLECAGRSYTFSPGDDVVIGREESCAVVSANPTVSRRHARLVHGPDGWTLEDLGSSGGTFVDGARITTLPLTGSVAAWLGDEDTGERVVIVAKGTHKLGVAARVNRASRRNGAPLIAAVLALAILAVAGGWWLVRSGGFDENEMAQGTVRLVAGKWAGSGTIVDADKGLILTNAHVVAPSAPGQAVDTATMGDDLDKNAKFVQIAVADGKDREAEPRYKGIVVASDGYLDLAVVKITETLAGHIIEPGSDDLDDLHAIELGDSDELETGDNVHVLGYPGSAQSNAVTLTDGVISGPVKDERLGSNRAMLNISADIRHGNSGGLAADDDGQLIGIPTIIREGEVASMRPVNWAKPLIDAARSGKKYRSPWIRPLHDEKISNVSLVVPGSDAGIDFSCDGAALESIGGAIGVSFDFEGFSAEKHQDLLVDLYVNRRYVGSTALADDYPVSWPSKGCATVTVPIDMDKVVDDDGSYTVDWEIGLGPDYVKVP